jgi:hypothetical protein
MDMKYIGPLEIGQVFTAPDNDGRLGFRRVRLVGFMPDDPETLILEEMPSRVVGRHHGELLKCPELNLRIVFELEEVPDRV